MNRFLLDACQRWLNRHLAESTAARDRVRALDGRSLAIHVRGLGVQVVITASGGAFAVEAGHGAGASATLSGTPLDLLGLLGADGGRPPAGRFRDSSAEISGRVEIAEAFGEALRLARPDAEEELARWIGDIPAQGIGRLGRGLGAWTVRSARALETDAAEYLQEEARVLPSAPEARALFAEVERLRDDVDRTAERVARLARRKAGR